jgi:hypothetical protein
MLSGDKLAASEFCSYFQELILSEGKSAAGAVVMK